MKTIEDCVSAALAAMSPEARERFQTDPLGTMRDALKSEGPGRQAPCRAPGRRRRLRWPFLCQGRRNPLRADAIQADGRTSPSPMSSGTGSSRRFRGSLTGLSTNRTQSRSWRRCVTGLPSGSSSVTGRSPPWSATVRSVLSTLLTCTSRARRACRHARLHSPLVCPDGAIILVDREQKDEPVVRYASVRPDPTQGWPRVYPWPGQKVPTAHPLRFITEAAHVQRRTYWATPWGERADFYMDAVAISSRRAIAVLADTDLWGAETFHPQTRRDFDERPEQEIDCCGQIRTSPRLPMSGLRTGPLPELRQVPLRPPERRARAVRRLLLPAPTDRTSWSTALCEDCR